jgi:hypothetical protein
MNFHLEDLLILAIYVIIFGEIYIILHFAIKFW